MPAQSRRLLRRKLVRWLALVGSVVVIAVIVLFAAAWMRSPATSGVLSLARSRVGSLGGTPVSLSAISPVLEQAVVDTEDERFYRHHGVDLIGVGRALVYDMSHANTSQGASTITEQLVKDLYLGGDDHSPWRKLEAAAMALRVEHHTTKAQILDAYLNTVYFGHGAYGVEAAARGYLGVSAATLTPAQATLLAGLIQAPSADDPFTDPADARGRQVEVISSMVRRGDMTTAQGDRILSTPLALRGGAPLPSVPHPVLTAPSNFSGQDAIAGLLAILGGVAIWVVGRRRDGPSRGQWARLPRSSACSSSPGRFARTEAPPILTSR